MKFRVIRVHGNGPFNLCEGFIVQKHAKVNLGHHPVSEGRWLFPGRPSRSRAGCPVECAITAMKASRQGPLLVHATCPDDGRILPGLFGQILDPQGGGPLKDGAVTVKTVSKGKVVAEATQLKQPVKATRLQFWVHH